MVLNLDLPTVVEEPSRDEVVVVGVEEVIAAPCLVREAIGEFRVLQNFRPIRYCSARQAWQATVNPVAGCAIEVPPDQIHGAEELPHVGAIYAAKLLICSDASHFGVLEGSQEPFVELLWKPDIIVQQQRDPGLDLRDCPTQLATLIGLADRQYLDALGPAHLFDHLVDTLDP